MGEAPVAWRNAGTINSGVDFLPEPKFKFLPQRCHAHTPATTMSALDAREIGSSMYVL